MISLTRSPYLLLAAITGLMIALGSGEAAEDPADLPVRKVQLYSSGVGYFEHFGTVTGNASSELLFKTEQINDVLKSLLLQDLAGGTIGTVVYPSRDPLSKILGSFQVDLSENPSLPDILRQLRGSEVVVRAGAETVSGTILGLESRQEYRPDIDLAVEVHILNIISDGILRPTRMDEVRSLEFEDPVLQKEFEEALSTLAGARGSEKKPVRINFRGEGERVVRVGYLVETPIWKTSYRLILPHEDKPGMIQGWAIVENQTDNDWSDVALSLVSGRPISFIQDLYQPLYVPRPVVEPELHASLRPERYDEGLDYARRIEGLGEPATDKVASSRARNMMRGMAMADAAEESLEYGFAAPAEPTAGGRDRYYFNGIDPTSSVRAAAEAGEVGELFEYLVSNVTLPRQRSAMLPIVTEEIETERLSIYNENTLAKHPLNGARLLNTTGKHLLQGPITVLDGGSYAGDAQIGNLPPGQERLLSYAIDLEVLADATQRSEENHLVTGKIVRGILELQRRLQARKEYQFQNRSESEKRIVAEHPIRKGWDLVDTPDPVETTESVYRFEVEVPSDATGTLTVQEQVIQSESIAILSANLGQLAFYSRSGAIPNRVKSALSDAMEMKREMVEIEREIENRRRKIQEIAEEQSRIRDNMQAVGNRQSEYYARLLSKLDDQETEIEKLQSEMMDLEERLGRKRKELEDYLSNLNVS